MCVTWRNLPFDHIEKNVFELLLNLRYWLLPATHPGLMVRKLIKYNWLPESIVPVWWVQTTTDGKYLESLQ